MRSRSFPTTVTNPPEPAAGRPAPLPSSGRGATPAPAPSRAAGLVDLTPTSGLPLWLDREDAVLVLSHPGEELQPEAQPLHLLRSVLLDPEAPGPQVPYWTYSDVALPTDEGVFRERRIRHNLLLLRPGRFGAEFAKTWGHVQACADGALCPEAYGVLHGRALFLLQQHADEPVQPGGRIRLADVRWIEANAGDKVVVPATYGLTVVNLGREPVVASSLVADQAWPVHLPYEQAGGAAYYVTAENDEVCAEPNRRYAEPVPAVRCDRPLCAPELGVEDRPLYSAFVHEPGRFAWLLEGAPAVTGVC